MRASSNSQPFNLPWLQAMTGAKGLSEGLKSTLVIAPMAAWPFGSGQRR